MSLSCITACKQKAMLIRFIFVIILFICATGYAEIYRWSDSAGVVHFSDTPHAGSQIISPPQETNVTVGRFLNIKNKVLKKNELTDHRKLVIMQPENETTLRNNSGEVSIKVHMLPDLKSGEYLGFFIDEQLLMSSTNYNVSLSGIDRGSHTLFIKLMNKDHIALNKSEKIIFYMHRPLIKRINKIN